jgi:hypothetical protein
VNTEPLPGSLVTVTSPPIMRAGNGKAKTSAAEALRGRGIGLAELLKQLCLLLCGHADAGVGDGELNEAAPLLTLRGLLRIARECHKDALELNDRSPRYETLGIADIPHGALSVFDSIGKYILTAHALELGLKAFLAKHGVTKKELSSDYRLDRLYREAVHYGLDLSFIPEVVHTISWVNKFHNQGALLRYDAGTRELPQCDTLFPIIDAVLDASTASRGPQAP